MGRIIGIDLGTTYSCVAVFNERKGIFEVLPSKSGQQTTPSVVGLNAKGEVIVGDSAKRQLATKPDATVSEIKRHMGELDATGAPHTTPFAGRPHSPEEISAYILRELKESAERALGEKVTGAIITVPAYFEEPQRQATMRAGKMAGLDVKRIINEPTAAAIAYGHDQTEDEDEDEDAQSKPIRLLIYDLGGGTFDVSIIEIEKGNIRVKSTHGNHYLGGVDFDAAVSHWICTKIRETFQVDIEAIAAAGGKEGERARSALGRLRVDAESYKKELSSQESVSMSFPMLPVADPKTGEPLDVELELTRSTFENLIGAKIRETVASVEKALQDARMKPTEIDEIILVGGSTRIPLVKRTLASVFGKEPRTDIHPDLCVALGAAHEAVKHIDVNEVDSPEQRAAIESKVADLPTVVDVTGHSLGVAVEGIYMSVLIPRQTPIPALITQSYVTATDNQSLVRVQVFQGEQKLVSQNTSLREFLLENLPARPAGQVKIEITFTLDSNDTLTVGARDTITNQQREVEIVDERLRGINPIGLMPSGEAPRAGTAAASAGAMMPSAAPVVVPERFQKYVRQAQELLPRLSPGDAKKLNAALDLLFSAVRANNAPVVEAAGSGLMDALFEVRP